MLHQRYPEASKRCTEIVRNAMESAPDDLPRAIAAQGAFVLAEAMLEHEGLVKTSGARFSEREIPFLLNWSRP